MAGITAKTDKLTYLYHLDTDLHEFNFDIVNVAAVNAWIEEMDRIYAGISADAQVRILIDITRVNMLPASYGFGKVRAWAQTLEVHPEAKAVIIHKPDFVMSLVSQFFKNLPLDRMWSHLDARFYVASRRDEAIRWLLG